MSHGESLISLDRKIIRQPANPLDKCTIVSLMPKKIVEVKYTITPGVFEIEAAPEGDFSILVVGSSSWFKETEENQPYLEIPHSSIIVAESVISDYLNGCLGCNMGDKSPGLFYVRGEYTKDTIEKNDEFKRKYQVAVENQKRWYRELVQIADVGWAKTNGNPIAVSDDARYGAKMLGLERAWLKDYQSVSLISCKSCGELVNPNFPVCRFCKAILDPVKAKDMGLTFAI
jgi:hypothetical protein